MNSRIDSLIEECTDRHFSECGGGFETFDRERFAELIVAECAELCSDLDGGENMFSRGIRRHFGIEP